MKNRARRAGNTGAPKSNAPAETVAAEEADTEAKKPAFTVISNDDADEDHGVVRPKMPLHPRAAKEEKETAASGEVEAESELPEHKEEFSFASEADAEPEAEEADSEYSETDESAADADYAAASDSAPVQVSSASRFDLRFALVLVGLVVSVNILLLVLLGTHRGTASSPTQVVEQPPVPTVSSVGESGVVLRDREVRAVKAVPPEAPPRVQTGERPLPLPVPPIAAQPEEAPKPLPPVAARPLPLPEPPPAAEPKPESGDLLSIINRN